MAEQEQAEDKKLYSGPTWKLVLNLFLQSLNDKARHGGVLGWLEARPGWVLVLRMALSLAILAVHLLLTIHVWRSESWIAGAITGACFLFAELYWAVSWAIDGAVAIPALLIGLTVVYFVFSSIVLPKLAVAWRETGQVGQDDDDA